MADVERCVLSYEGNEAAWQFVGGPWKVDEEGEGMMPPAHSFWCMDMHTAFYTEMGFRDCVFTGKFQFRYGGGACPELMVRCMDSRRFYTIRFSHAGNNPSKTEEYLMASIWKGDSDGFRRMIGYRRRVGFYRVHTDPYKWYDVRVKCIGPEILVYFEDSFVCAVTDDEYTGSVVGVANPYGIGAWKDLAVEGLVSPKPAWSMAEIETPKQLRLGQDAGNSPAQAGGLATLLPDDEIFVGFRTEGEKQWVTRSRDYGLTWEKPVEGTFGCYVKSQDELWSVQWAHGPDITWEHVQEAPDLFNRNTFWHNLSRSKDGGRTWSEPEKMELPYPIGHAYVPVEGKIAKALDLEHLPHDLSDGAVGLGGCTCGYVPAEGKGSGYHSNQVQFFRTTDGGKTWSTHPVDASHWEGNENAWVELEDGELLCLMRSNYSNHNWASRSRDKGRTWSKAQPAIPFFGCSAPAVIRTKENVLVLATRVWGIFTSVDNGRTWSPPTHIRGYTGSGIPASLLEMSDGRIFVLSSTHANDRESAKVKAQFIRVDADGAVNPALPGPGE